MTPPLHVHVYIFGGIVDACGAIAYECIMFFLKLTNSKAKKRSKVQNSFHYLNTFFVLFKSYKLIIEFVKYLFV